jgi:hypothetical protein
LGTLYSRLAQVNENRVRSAADREDSQAIEKFRQRQQEQENQALQAFQQSLPLAHSTGDRSAQMRSLLGITSVYIKGQKKAEAENTLNQAIELLK